MIKILSRSRYIATFVRIYRFLITFAAILAAVIRGDDVM